MIGLDDFDMELREDSHVGVLFHPGWAAAGMFVAKLVVGLAVGYGMQKLFGTDASNIANSPDYKNNQASPTYNLNNSQNIAMAGNPVPSTYGTIKTFPPLLSKPYYRYEDNEQYMYSLMTFGHGTFNINDLYVGESNITTLDSGDLQYKTVTPPNYINECDLRAYINDANYHQQVYTSPEVSNLELLPGRKMNIERFRFQDNVLHFYRGTDGGWPSTNISIGDKLTFIQGADGVGVHNNVGVKTVTAVDNQNHTVTFDSTVDEAFRDIFDTKTTDFRNNSVITSSGFYVTISTSVFAKQTFKDEFKIGQRMNYTYLGFGGVEETRNYAIMQEPVYTETASSSTVTFRINRAILDISLIASTDVNGTFESANTYGYYKANPVGTSAKYVELDVVFPNGLYRSDTLGNLLTRKVEFQAIIKDETGKESIHNFATVDATVTAVRKTIVISVDDLSFGSYDVKLQRLTAEALDTTTSDRLFVERLKAPIILERDNVWDDMTLLWVKAKATNAISSAGTFMINANITRTDVGNTISEVITDLYTNTIYGAGLNASDLVIPTTTETFNGSFETKIPVLDAMKSVGEAGRYIVTPKNGSVIVRKEEAKPIATALFNETNIIPGTLDVSYSFGASDDTEDSVEVTYRDPVTFEEKVARYPNVGVKPSTKTLFGVTDRDLALRDAQYRYKSSKRRISYKFSTGIQGIIPEYLDKIIIGHASIDAGEPGIVEYVDGTNVFFGQVEQKSQVSFIDELFVVHGPYSIDSWLNNVATISTLPSFVTAETKCHLYDTTEETNEAVVTRIAPKSQDEVEIQAIIYDATVYDYTPESDLVYESNSECGFDGFGYFWSDSDSYVIGDIVVCSDRTQYAAIANSTGESPCDGTNVNWEVVPSDDPRYLDGVSSTPKMPGETDNGATVEVGGAQDADEPGVNWAALAGMTVLGGLIAWGAQAGLEALFGECDFGMHYHEGTNTCEFCPENQEYNEETNECSPCGDGFEWDPSSKLCVVQGTVGAGMGVEWKETISYKIGDIISWLDRVYVSIDNDNQNYDPESNPDFWLIIGNGGALWRSATEYNLGDIVSYDGIIYTSLVALNLNTQPDTNPTEWKVTEGGTGTGSEKGGIKWNNATAYVIGDVVSYGADTVYVALTNNTNKVPSTSTSDWVIAVGEQGIQGPIGDCTNCPETPVAECCKVVIGGTYVDYDNAVAIADAQAADTKNNLPEYGCNALDSAITTGCDLIVVLKEGTFFSNFPDNIGDWEMDCGKGWMQPPLQATGFSSCTALPNNVVKYRMLVAGDLVFSNGADGLEYHVINDYSGNLTGLDITNAYYAKLVQFYKAESAFYLNIYSSTVNTICTNGTVTLTDFLASRSDLVNVNYGLDFSNITNFANMFDWCQTLVTANIDTISGTNFSSMFRDCDSLIIAPTLDTSSGTNFSSMFRYCGSLTSISDMNTSLGTDFTGMFSNCSSLVCLTSINTTLQTSTTNIFYGCTSLVAPDAATQTLIEHGYNYVNPDACPIV